jgi:hypothetical protein
MKHKILLLLTIPFTYLSAVPIGITCISERGKLPPSLEMTINYNEGIFYPPVEEQPIRHFQEKISGNSEQVLRESRFKDFAQKFKVEKWPQGTFVGKSASGKEIGVLNLNHQSPSINKREYFGTYTTTSLGNILIFNVICKTL